jgi:hypothetical protein
MDFAPHTNPEKSRRVAAFWVVAGVLLAAYAALLHREMAAVAGGSDSAGYLSHAKLLSRGAVQTQPREIPGLSQAKAPRYLYIPLGFRPAPSGTGMVPTYPPGFPLLLLLARGLVGWPAAPAVTMVAHALAGVLLTYALARTAGLSRAWATCGAAAAAASPLFLFMSAQTMSDVPAMAWTALAMVAALRARSRTKWAVLAGFALAMDVLIRPTNVLAFVPALVALGPSPRRLAGLVAGGLPGAVFLLLHGAAAYGRAGATGYGDVSPDFGWRFLPDTVVQYALWLPVVASPFVFLGLALPLVREAPSPVRWALASWCACYLAFFAFYRYTHETWWYLRFLLPAVPAFLVSSMLVLRHLLQSRSARPSPWGRLAAASAAAAAACASYAADSQIKPLLLARPERAYPMVADFVRRKLPADAVCLSAQATGALYYYTDLTFVRWDFVDGACRPALEAALAASKRPLYAVLFPYEYGNPAVLARMPGHWTEVGAVQGILVLRRDPARS